VAKDALRGRARAAPDRTAIERQFRSVVDSGRTAEPSADRAATRRSPKRLNNAVGQAVFVQAEESPPTLPWRAMIPDLRDQGRIYYPVWEGVMRLLYRLGSFTMADLDMPKTWEGAARWFLGGTIIFASGFEAVVLFWEGKFLLALGSLSVAVILMAVLLQWERLKAQLPRATGAFTAASKDGRLWAILLLIIAEASRFPANIYESWLYGLPLFVAVLLFFASWKYLKPPQGEQSSDKGAHTRLATTTEPATAQIDGQARLDLLHLLDFGVYQTTLVMLSELVARIPPIYKVDYQAPLPADLSNQQAHNDAQVYLQLVRRRICDGSERASRYESVMYNATSAAEQILRSTPQEERPKGIDPLILRDYAISFRQAVYTAAFLCTEQYNIEAAVISQRSTLIDRYRLRSK
jgi:hypothetical protein